MQAYQSLRLLKVQTQQQFRQTKRGQKISHLGLRSPPRIDAPPRKENVRAQSPRRPNRAFTQPEVTHFEHLTDDTSESHNGDIYQVEKLLKQRMKNGEHQFLIKWLGFPHSQNSWEPASNILNKSVIKQFYDQHPRATSYEDPGFQPRVTALLAEETISNSSVIAVVTYEDSSEKFAPSAKN